ncbi:acetyltransferase [Geobacillus thermopakistaniensis]|jgi:GNAT superfamily N-acetyltransferase|uniref:Acetyltransferase n=1 Tax=Geobacillus thermopakistaniensis (strain MAS1) TaxID=1408282 RepID=A0A7U9J9E2_GEOTM|nr:GNAT family N-acetyltransferase [Geobacillus sp. MAS1]ESU71331.1 acetyltransferase [Geobacillus sp. MAS1]
MKIKFAPLKAEDMDIVPELIREGLDYSIFEKTIFSCKGYSQYLKNIVKISTLHRNIKFFGAYIDGKLAGFTEWRILNDCVFLNNIYVSKAFRGRGIGEGLISEYMFPLLKQFNKNKVSLDVFDFNKKAIDWYRRLGFIEEKKSHWFLSELPIKNMNEPLNFIVEDYHIAEASHSIYHFSSFRILVNNNIYNIGRIGDHYYKLTDYLCLKDSHLLYSLYKLDPNRKILLITDFTELEKNNNINKVCSSIRMSLNIKKI